MPLHQSPRPRLPISFVVQSSFGSQLIEAMAVPHEFRVGYDFTSAMQMKLQALAPHLGCRCRDLWCFKEVDAGNGQFAMRVVLLNSTDDARSIELEVSQSFLNKKTAKHYAAFLAYWYIERSGTALTFNGGAFVRSEVAAAPRLQESASAASSSSDGSEAPARAGPDTEAGRPQSEIIYDAPGIDSAGQTDNYPAVERHVAARPYQVLSANIAIKSNTIIHLPTGSGRNDMPPSMPCHMTSSDTAFHCYRQNFNSRHGGGSLSGFMSGQEGPVPRAKAATGAAAAAEATGHLSGTRAEQFGTASEKYLWS